MRTSDLEARERKGIQVAKFLDQNIYPQKIENWFQKEPYYHWVRNFKKTSPFEGSEIKIETKEQVYYLHEHICPYTEELTFLLPIYAVKKKRGLKKEYYSFLLEEDAKNHIDFYCFYQEQDGEITGVHGFFVPRKKLQSFLTERGITQERIYQGIKQGKRWKEDAIWTLSSEGKGIWKEGYLYAVPSLRSRMIFLGLREEIFTSLAVHKLSVTENHSFV